MKYSARGDIGSFDHSDTLKMAEQFTPVTTVIEQSSGTHYSFRKFLWSGNWGICNANCSRILVRAKANYAYASILNYAQRLVAGNPNFGWDVYSLQGVYIGHIKPMSLDKVTNFLDEQRRNS